jgi:outer membrane protein assembly factor BamB
MKTRILPIVVIALLSPILSAYGSGESAEESFDWPCWRGPNHDGTTEESGWKPDALRGGAKVLWKANVGRGHSSIAIADGRLYTTGLVEREVVVHCLDAVTGRDVWRHSLDAGFQEPNSTPAVRGEDVYVLTADGILLCLKSKNGKIRWRKSLNADYKLQPTAQGWSTSPVVEGNLLLLNANKKQLGMDRKSGELVWSLDDEKPRGSYGTYASPVVFDHSGTRTVLFMGPGRLNAVIAESGEQLWSFPHNDRWHPIADPVVVGIRVFISLHEDCYMIEADGAQPRIIWEMPVLCSDIATSVIVDGYLYGTHFADRYISTNDWHSMRRYDWPLRCVDIDTGAVIWQQNMEHSTLISADQKLILLGLKGTLRIAEATPAGYIELGRGDVSGGEERIVFATPPVLCNGRIYCKNYLGDVICVDVRQ